MKKIAVRTWVFVSLFMLVFTLAIPGGAWAQTSTTLSFAPATSVVTTCAGDELEIAVMVANVNDLTAYHLELTFDPGVVEITDVVNGELLDDPTEPGLYEPTNGWDNDLGTITFGMAKQGTWENPPVADGSGSLIVITLRALGPGQSTTFVIDPVNSMLVHWDDAMPIEFTVTGTGEVSSQSCAPNDIALSNNRVQENRVIGTGIGTLSSTDPDGDLTFDYSLVGDYPDNASFQIVGDELKTNRIFNFEVLPNTFTINIRSTDEWGAYFDEEFTISIDDANDTPVLGLIGNQSVNELALLTFTATATDEDLLADTLTFSLTGTGIPAGASIDPVTGIFTWTPTEEQGPGSYSFSVQVSDGILIDYETITVTVGEVNAAPVLAGIGSQTGNEQVALTFTASATDEDLPANTLTYSLVAAPTGAGIDSASGAFSWVPTEIQGPGTYPLTVRVCDNATPAACDEEAITVTVAEVNTAPQAVADSYTTLKNATLSVPARGVLWNDTDADLPENTLTVELVAGIPSGEGSLTLNADGSFTYTPPADQTLTTSFTYRVSDGEAYSDTVVVTITVNLSNEAPTDILLSNVNILENSPIDTIIGSLSSLDPNSGDHHDYSLVDDVNFPDNANFNISADKLRSSVEFDYEDAKNTYTIRIQTTDLGGLSYQESFTIYVTDVNEAPTADNLTAATAEGNSIEITLPAADPDGDLLTFAIISPPSKGSLSGTGAVRTYSPYPDSNGVDSFTFQVSDDYLVSGIATVTIAISALNDAPVNTVPGTQVIPEDSDLFFAAEKLISVSDVDVAETTGGTLEITISVLHGHLTLAQITGLTFTAGDGTDDVTMTFSGLPASINAALDGLKYDPDQDFVGSDTLTIISNDQGNTGEGGVKSDTDTVSITLTQVNDAPVISPLDPVTGDEGSLISFTAVASDVDGQNLFYSLVNAPAGANIDPVTGEFSWTPTESQGPGSYTFQVCVYDGSLKVCETVTVTILEVNVAPVLNTIGDKTIDEETLLTFTASASDVDIPSNVFTFSLTGDVPAGASITGGGVFTWTPTEEQGYGVYTFSIKICDDGDPILCDEEEITVTVNEVNSAPVANGQSVTTFEDTALVLTLTATDEDEDPLTWIIVSPPIHGTLSGDTQFPTYTPDTDYCGTDSFTFKVKDSLVYSNVATVDITITSVNDAPVANDQTVTTFYNTPVTFVLSVTDADINDSSAVILITEPIHGSIECNQITCLYTPELGWSGADAFIYKVQDVGGLDSNEATVTILVESARHFYLPIIYK